MSKLQKLWREKELLEHLGADAESVKERSRIISVLIKNGLPYIEIGNKRCFLDEHVLDHLLKFNLYCKKEN